jgi:lysophospholipase L1-like esterase
MSAKEPVGKGHAGLVRSKHRASDPPMLGRKSVLMGMLTSGFVIANAAQPSATAAGTVKPGAIAATTPTYLTKWAPSQAYVRGQQVVSPNNDVVSANVAHTSGSTFNAANWSVSSTYGQKTAIKRAVPNAGIFSGLRTSAVPTFTVSAVGAATTVANPVTVGVDQIAQVLQTGAPAKGFYNGGYYGTGVTASGADYPATGWETVLYGRYIDLIIDEGRSYRVFVDGRAITDLAAFSPAPAGDYRLIVDCGSTGAHHIRLLCNAVVKGFTYDGTNGNIYPPASPLPLKDYYIGDSWVQGYGSNGSTHADAPAGLGAYCSELLGSTSYVGGQSGTGYTNNAGGGAGQTTYPNRVVPSVVPIAPDRVIVIGSVNDLGASPSAIQAAATATFSALATNLPNTDVFVFGIQYVPANVGNATYNAADDAIAAAAAAAPNVVFRSTRTWAIPAAFVTSDGVHLLNAGYKYVGSRMAQVIAAASAL